MDASQFLRDHAESAVRATQWFRTAPASVQPSLKVKAVMAMLH